MNFFKRYTLAFAVVAIVFAFLVSCDDDFKTIGTGLVASDNFDVSDTLVNEVFIANKRLGPVRSNFLPLYQLGVYDDGIYGRREAKIATQLRLTTLSPTFGVLSQDTENANAADGDTLTLDENETVTTVYLDIPFFSTADSVTDGDNTYKLDSIFGNKLATFNIKVEELTFFLRDLDPDTGFQRAQQYYTTAAQPTGAPTNPTPDFSMFTGALLHDAEYKIDANEIRIIADEPDENGDPVVTRLTPRIRIPLSTAFFQSKILDAEGTGPLSTNNLFADYFRGLYLTTHTFSDNVLMLLDVNNANVIIEYEYNTVDDTSNDIVKAESTYTLDFGGNIVNTFDNAAYSTVIESALNDTDAPDKVYLKGGEGIMGEIKLFDNDGSDDVLQGIKDEEWLINEASLSFYVDEVLMDGKTIPSRVYLYDLDNDRILFDYAIDPTLGVTDPLQSRSVFGGILEDTDDGMRYKIRITNHLNNIVRKDSTNVRLGLAVTSNIANVNISQALSDNDISTPEAAVVDPQGVVLFGNGASVPEPKKIKLEIYFTKLD